MFQFRFVEVGRVAYISSGRDAGKLAVIVDVIDQNRVMLPIQCIAHTMRVWLILKVLLAHLG